ncbi:MAG: PilX N-terminal domain-containing pilus assembly protein [Pseudomonadota bacterium]
MNNALTKNKKNQSGTSLLVVLLVLMGVTALGIMAIQTSSTELDVAANDKFHKMAFFAADGASEMTTELIEQNIEERGFPSATWGTASILKLDFYTNAENTIDPTQNKPSETNRDIEVPGIGGSNTYIKVYGDSALSTGSALQIAAGYEGLGKASAGGGAMIVYDIRSLAIGPSRSMARISPRWRHLL